MNEIRDDYKKQSLLTSLYRMDQIEIELLLTKMMEYVDSKNLDDLVTFADKLTEGKGTNDDTKTIGPIIIDTDENIKYKKAEIVSNDIINNLDKPTLNKIHKDLIAMDPREKLYVMNRLTKGF